MNLTPEEYVQVVSALGREPNRVELGIFSVMWSEHCCYKSSKIHLKTLPTRGRGVLQGPGENAGVVDIGGGYAAAFKIESHNHPSFIEPYQGAATGVGGILRDIFTMGARPVALMDSLHFGAMSHPRTAGLLRGVVAGIGGYGNCVGIPTIGGETRFDEGYNGNILVNAFALGIVRADRIFKGVAKGEGNPVILVGSKTGRDGIHGATMASDSFEKESESKRPTVQVGDPFTEKKLLEACMEAFALEGAIVGIQDMGAAGFTCSSFEMASKGDCGMELWLDRIPVREEGMTPYEIMLSESQERMLMVAKKGREGELKEIFEKWELEFAVVGRVIAEKRVRGFFHREAAFDLPVGPVVEEAPVYDRPAVDPSPKPPSARGVGGHFLLPDLLASPDIASKRWVWRQYDSSIGTNTLAGPGGNAAVIRVKENGARLALTVGSNAWFCAADPYRGTVETVLEGIRNLACVGAVPIGLTNCLNFGNPENPEIMGQLREAIRGLADICREMAIPVTGGNVSLYNETEGKNIPPTPVIAMVGLVADEAPLIGYGWQKAGDRIYGVPGEARWLKKRFLIEAIRLGLLRSAHAIGRGGSAAALARCCFEKGLGAVFGAEVLSLKPDDFIVSCSPGKESAFLDWARAKKYPVQAIGTVGGERLVLPPDSDFAVAELERRWESFPE